MSLGLWLPRAPFLMRAARGGRGQRVALPVGATLLPLLALLPRVAWL